MSEWCGWAGKILRIDLTKEKIVETSLTKELAYNFLGGRGFNIKTLWDEIRPGIDPLSPENVLCFGVGPLVGTIVSLCCRFNVSAKSPETGILGDSNSGGFWGPELKFAGYDQVVITGKASKPTYLYINDDQIELRDASHVWGKNVPETEKIILKEVGDKNAKIASIGVAGENLVRIACVMVDIFRAAAWTGMGDVMGSKNLKALVVRGTNGVKVAMTKKLEELARLDRDRLMKNEFIQNQIGHLGTPLISDMTSEQGLLSWKGDTDVLLPEEIKSISGETYFKNYYVQLKGCFNCPVHCARYFEIKDGPFAGVRGSTGEFETIWLCGAHCGNLNLPSILKINNLCNEYGMNTISVGAAISLAIELYQAGIVTKKETKGTELEWGDYGTIIELIHKIAHREDFGNMLAEGHYNMARILGKEAERLCVHVKGLHRSSFWFMNYAWGLSLATSTRGADHLRGSMDTLMRPDICQKKWRSTDIADPFRTIGKGFMVPWGQQEFTLADCLGRCKCGVNMWEIACPMAGDAEDVVGEGRAATVSAATGLVMTPRDLEMVAERVYNLERAFIVREGITRKHDMPPWKTFNVPIPRGQLKGTIATEDAYDEMLDEYYKHMSWDLKTGIPTRSKLEDLELKYVADELEKNAPYPEWLGPPLHSEIA
jgi:aldehyde:ferredoxin oxidoreductase